MFRYVIVKGFKKNTVDRKRRQYKRNKKRQDTYRNGRHKSNHIVDYSKCEQTQTFETKAEIIGLNKKKIIRLDKKARANYTLPKREEMFEEIMAANFLETTKNINNTKPQLYEVQ